MNKIPTHRITDLFQGEMVMLRKISRGDHLPKINYVHKDDYYMFFFIEKGEGKFLVDFEEYEIRERTVFCILPGQVHFPSDYIWASGWILAVDSVLIKEEYKAVFEKISFMETRPEVTDEVMEELSTCATLIEKRLVQEKNRVQEVILHSLIAYYTGLIAEVYLKGFPVLINKRSAIIASQFKVLLAANYRKWKRPSQYAAELNISPVYLNEIVKKVTGMTVTGWIQHEVIFQAKRLLYYTDMNVKEVALELGYEDWAYFTRLFSKSTTLSPTQFRKKYLK